MRSSASGKPLLESATPLGIVEQLRRSEAALTIPQLAKLISLGRRTVYDAIERGSLPAYRIGTALRLDPQATANWLESRCTAA